MGEKSVSMSAPESPDRVLDPESRARREFLKRVGQASVAVPAAALLLSVNAHAASATLRQYGGGTPTYPDHEPFGPFKPIDEVEPRRGAWIRLLLRWLRG